MTRFIIPLALLLAACASEPVDRPPVSGVEIPASVRVDFRGFEPTLSEDYTLGPCDRLVVRVADLESPGVPGLFTREVTAGGKIHLPMAGEIDVRGQTLSELRGTITTALGQYLIDPRVSVELSEYCSKRVSVFGKVRAPGEHAIPRNSVDIVQALSLARGLADGAAPVAYLVRRTEDGAEQYRIDLEQLFERGPGAIAVQPGDVLHVPRAEEAFVQGYVERPGGYAITEKTTALGLVARAGGWLRGVASPTAAFLRQRQADGSFRVIALDLEAIERNEAVDHEVRPGDMVIVPQTGWQKTKVILERLLIERVPGAPPVYR